MTRTMYGVRVTAIIDERTGGFEYPDGFEADVEACFLRQLSPEAAADELLSDYTGGDEPALRAKFPVRQNRNSGKWGWRRVGGALDLGACAFDTEDEAIADRDASITRGVIDPENGQPT